MMSRPTPLEILFAGSGAFGVPTLEMLVASGHRIVRVYTQPDRPAGRGKKLTPTPIAERAESLGIETVRTENINIETLPFADVLVVIAFGQKIAPAVVRHPRLGSINLHASRLPKYRGAAPINWAIINGDSITGNSVIRLADRMDAGAMLAQSEVTIGETETAAELHDRLAIDGAPLVVSTLEHLATATATETEQDHTLATVAPKLSRETAVVDFVQPASVIARRINGLSPWPGCRVRVVDPAGTELGRVTLLRAQAIDLGRVTGTVPGVVTAELMIAAGTGAVAVLQLQPEGKRPMSLGDYTRGNRWTAGLRIEAI